jgi:hypothetical protein
MPYEPGDPDDLAKRALSLREALLSI